MMLPVLEANTALRIGLIGHPHYTFPVTCEGSESYEKSQKQQL